MKKLILAILVITTLQSKAQLTSFFVNLTDTTLWYRNPLTGDSIQLTKLPKTLYTGEGTGTAYNLTTTPALVTFGTTSPSITLAKAGNYLITWRVRTEYVGATIAVNSNVTFKIRRTNNTATDLRTTGFKTLITTLLSGQASDITASFMYTNATAGDVLEIWGSMSSLATLGNVSVVEANIIAIKQY